MLKHQCLLLIIFDVRNCLFKLINDTLINISILNLIKNCNKCQKRITKLNINITKNTHYKNTKNELHGLKAKFKEHKVRL